MKIIRLGPTEVPLADFADAHGLAVEVQRATMRGVYHAWFSGHPEIKEGIMLQSAYGVGVSEGEAIADYCSRISGRTLVWDAHGAARRELEVPAVFWHSFKDSEG